MTRIPFFQITTLKFGLLGVCHDDHFADQERPSPGFFLSVTNMLSRNPMRLYVFQFGSTPRNFYRYPQSFTHQSYAGLRSSWVSD